MADLAKRSPRVCVGNGLNDCGERLPPEAVLAELLVGGEFPLPPPQDFFDAPHEELGHLKGPRLTGFRGFGAVEMSVHEEARAGPSGRRGTPGRLMSFDSSVGPLQ
jgi:hypothetical protein